MSFLFFLPFFGFLVSLLSEHSKKKKKEQKKLDLWVMTHPARKWGRNEWKPGGNMGRVTKHHLFPRSPQEVQEGEKEKKDEDKEKEKKKEAEPNFQLLENPARVMPAQLKVLNMPESCRYQPFKPVGASLHCPVDSLMSQLTINIQHKATSGFTTGWEMVNHFIVHN